MQVALSPLHSGLAYDKSPFHLKSGTGRGCAILKEQVTRARRPKVLHSHPVISAAGMSTRYITSQISFQTLLDQLEL